MSGAEEEWVKTAMIDDTVVAELLVRLQGPPPRPLLPKPAALPLEWSVRQRRSRHVSVNNSQSKKNSSQRASPTTPLSWSGPTSPSGGSAGSGGAGGGGGCEESSSRPPIQNPPTTTTRSKVNGDIERTASKRSRKKKTLAELKDEEVTLLKERRQLKRDIAALRVNLEKQRASNQNLKRVKIELRPPVPVREIKFVEPESISDQLQEKTAAGHPIPPVTLPLVTGNDATLQSSTSNNCPDDEFVLPDLNVAFEEDPCSGVIIPGVS